MNCPASPVGIGPMLRKFKKPLRPNTTKISPSKMRAIKVTIFISRFLSIVSKTLPVSGSYAVSGVELFGKILPSPGRKPGRFPACYFVCESNLSGRIRTQVGMRLEVPEHRSDLRSSREESREDVGRDLREGEVVTLSIKHVDDLIEAHELTDER